MARDSKELHRCERCGKPTARLLGAGAQVRLRDPERVQVRVAALGYCLDHKDDVVPDWVAALGPAETVELISDQLVELRPRDASAFVTTMEQALGQELGGVVPVNPGAGVPTACTHCGGRLLWGEGPHASDARVLAKTAFAWECQACRAAGLLTAI